MSVFVPLRCFYLSRHLSAAALTPHRSLNSKIPTASVSVHDVAAASEAEDTRVKVDADTVQRLERLSLVDFANQDGVR